LSLGRQRIATPIMLNSAMARILVIEDESDLVQVLEYNLRREGHEVTSAMRGREGLRLAKENPPDLALLDLMLPDIPGTEVCKALKASGGTSEVRVVMLTAKSDEVDRILGFEIGADDYVVKPFSMRELMLRVRAILGRPAGDVRSGSPGRAPDEFGALRIDRDAHRIWVGGGEVELTALEFRLLVTLFDRRDRVQSRKKLLDDVWRIDGDVETRTVDTHMKRLREKLGPAGPYIETVRGVGYRFARSPDRPAR
jgi:two-component system phosphate regulon response regulator PhoB